jgi:hypothetical protein
LPYSQLTAQQAAQFGFDERLFEQQKYQWGQEFERDRFEWENLSAWQQSQQGIQLRDLGLQERIAQAEFQKRPMDWLAAWQFSNPTWSGVPRGTANPNAQPYIPIPEGGFPPPSLPPTVGGLGLSSPPWAPSTQPPPTTTPAPVYDEGLGGWVVLPVESEVMALEQPPIIERPTPIIEQPIIAQPPVTASPTVPVRILDFDDEEAEAIAQTTIAHRRHLRNGGR